MGEIIKNQDSRREFIDTLCELAEKDKNVCFIIPDVGFLYTDKFEEKYPDHFVNTGVTECFATVFAATLALDGWRPFLYSMINFVLFRPAEMVRNGIVCHNTPVTLIGVKGSSSYKFLGFSHNMLHDNEDIDFCKNIGLTSIVPESVLHVRSIILGSGKVPLYIRL